MNNREFGVDPERAIEALSSVLHTSDTRGLHLDPERAAEAPNTDGFGHHS